MNNKLWKAAELLIQQSLALEASEREKFIENRTVDDQELRQLIASILLAEHDQAFMQSQPGVEVSEISINQDNQVFGHFTILEKVATGGMGRIFKAKNNASDIDVFVALKLIRRELISEKMVQRFQNEQSILGKLKHHHIATLFDAGVVDEKPYLATEWVDGIPIDQYVKNKQLTISQILQLFLQACEAVAYAHQKLVIHRDLKPANIMIDTNGQVKLLDFGIAKLIDSESSQLTQTQVFTPDYASPEQINGEICTTATDVYALGVLLFELIVGQKRFNHKNHSMAEKIADITQPKTIYPSQVMLENMRPQVNKVKGALDIIINQAMHPDVNRRYDSVYALISDIRCYQHHLPIRALGDGWIYRSKMFFKRNSYASLFGLMLVLTLTGGLIYTNSQKAQAIEAQLQAQVEAERSQQMLRFFMTMLESASPVSGGSTQISVQEMLVKGSKKIDLKTIKDAVNRALIAGKFAEIFRELLAYDLAIDYSYKALEYYAQDLEKHASKYLFHNMKIAGNLKSQNLNDQALEHLTVSYEKVKQYPLEPSIHAEAMINFGWHYKTLNQPKKALDYYQKAEDLANQVNDFESLGKVKYYQHITLKEELSNQELDHYLQQAQKFFMQAYPDGHPDLLAVRNSLALSYSAQGEYIKADKMYQVLHTEKIHLYGYKDFDHLTNHAGILYFLGQFTKAFELTSESLELIENQGVGAGFNTMAARIVQARCLTELGRFDEASLGLQEASDFFQTRFGPDHFVTMILRSYQLDLLVKSGQESVNPNEEVELMQLAEKQLNDSTRAQERYARTAFIVATSYWSKGQYKQALSHLEKAQPTLEFISKKEDWFYWMVEAGVLELRNHLKLEYDQDELNAAKLKLFKLLPANHWYHQFFTD